MSKPCHKLRYPSKVAAEQELRPGLRAYRCSCGSWHVGAPGRRGRPRKHENDAAKQAAYRRRKKNKEHERLVQRVLSRTPVQDGKSLADVERELRAFSTSGLLDRERVLFGSPGAAGKHSHHISMLKRVVREVRNAELS